jgi:hypothetical protein
MFAPVTPYVGVQPFNDWFTPDTIGRQQLGMIISAVDPYWGGGDFVYVRSNDALVKGSWATWDELWQATLIPSAANQGFPVGVAMAPMSAGKFGWLQVAGLAVYKTGATVAADAAIGIGAAGVAGAFSAGKQLVNVRNRRSATAAITRSAQQTAGSPVLRTTGFDGFFLGMALSGTGIPAGTVVGALDPDGMRIYTGSAVGVTGDKNSTATGQFTLTGTYTGYGAGLIQYPYAQGAIT